MGIRILQGGGLTTVQDLGRVGYQKSGFGTNGVMDVTSFRIANFLLGNEENTAALEFTLLGASMEFTSAIDFVLTGGDCSATLDGEAIEPYTVVHANAGSALKGGFVKSGARVYFAVRGGFQIETVMGSASTNLKCGLGGFMGRKLQPGDEIFFQAEKSGANNAGEERIIHAKPGLKVQKYIEDWQTKIQESKQGVTLRVILGPQDDYFTETGVQTFLSEEYSIGNESDRMGYRLEGAQIESKEGVDIISDGIVPGSIQIPAKGTPIILLADRQTTGGYAKIGTVISADLPLLAQCMPGTKIHFEELSVKKAQKILKKRSQLWNRLTR